MDSGVTQDFTFSEGVSLTILCRDQAEIDYYWNRITQQGQESMCGWCKDEFGVSWQIVPTQIATYLQNPGAGEALMKMKKIIIKDLIG
ncbi:3-demethylubiquinone-9 3-methyltransferase [compost metagenome]